MTTSAPDPYPTLTKLRNAALARKENRTHASAMTSITPAAPPKVDLKTFKVLDKVRNKEVDIATAHRSIGQLMRKSTGNIRSRFQLSNGLVFTPDNHIVHRSQVSKEVIRSNDPALLRKYAEDQKNAMTQGERQAILEQAIVKRQQKSDNKALERIQKIINDMPTRTPGPQGITYLHAALGESFRPELAGEIIHRLLMKDAKGKEQRDKVRFIIKGRFSRTVNGRLEWDNKWLSLNTNDSALTLSPPYYQGAIQHELEKLKPGYFSNALESDADVETTWHDIGIFATYEPILHSGGADGAVYSVIKIGLMKCRSYRSTNNNCMIACLLAATQRKVNRHDHLRKSLQIPLNIPIPAVSLHASKLAMAFRVDLKIVNEAGEELVNYKEGDLEVTMCLMVNNEGLGHYVLVMDKDYVKKRCPHCNIQVYDLEAHECNANNISYYNEQVNTSRQKFYTTRGLTQKRQGGKELTHAFFDFETLNEASKWCKAVTYNAGILIGDVYRSFWGKDSLTKFMEFVTSYPEPLLMVSYNGSGFDTYFIKEYIDKHKIPMGKRGPLITGGNILTLELGNGTKFFDLYRYTAPSSLDGLYNDCFNSEEGGKSFFPHQFLKKWEDIEYVGAPITKPELYTDYLASLEEGSPKLKKFQSFIKTLPAHYSLREESDKYLKIDCEVLQKCFNVISKQFTDDYGIDILNSITSSAAGEKLFRSMMPKDQKIELGLTKELYDLYKRSNYGGRVQPHRQEFHSKDIGKTYAEVLHNKDYLVDVDAVSLYPTVMKDNEYPVGEGRWLTKEQLEETQAGLDAGNLTAFKHGVYNVDVIPNTRLLVPVIPAKSDKGSTCWDLLPRTNQCYCLPDIVSGIVHGYKFVLRKGYVFDQTAKIFSEYITKVFKIKQEEDANELFDDEEERKKAENPHYHMKPKRYNPTRRMIAKLLMNCLYGKMSQKPIEDSSVTISTEVEFRKFLREYEWRDLHEMGDKVVVVGKKKDFAACVQKPMQLGSYILAYSRTLMTSFMDKLDPARLQIIDRASLEESWANTYTYGDTDALHAHASTIHRLEGILYDSTVKGATKELGMMSDELKGGLIIEEYCPAPKLYASKYIMPDNSIREKIKGKGVVSYKLKYEDFPRLAAEEQVSKSFFMMTKYRYSVPSTMREKGFGAFTIEGRQKTRTLGKTVWGGRVKVGGDSGLTVPHGFDLSLLE